MPHHGLAGADLDDLQVRHDHGPAAGVPECEALSLRTCLLNGHCGLDTLTTKVQAYRAPSKLHPTAFVAASLRHLVVALLRDPAARVLSE